MLHEWDGVEERSLAEGEGQVEWQRSGPGCPTRTAGTRRSIRGNRYERRGMESSIPSEPLGP